MTWLGWAALFAALGIRSATWDYSMLWTCVLFWGLVIFFDAVCGWWAMIPGALCNAIAMLANGGRMPVFDPRYEPAGWHVAGTADTNLPFLCDHGFLFGSSVGDILITVAIVVYSSLWLARQCARAFQ